MQRHDPVLSHAPEQAPAVPDPVEAALDATHVRQVERDGQAARGHQPTDERDRAVLGTRPVGELGLRAALRRLADAEARCLLHLADGSRHEAYVDRVGADFLEAREGLLVPYAGLVAVQRRDD